MAAAHASPFDKIETDLAILKWMVCFNLVGTLALVFVQLLR